ncbi:unnamed protein product [Anisakis simplex]|uniref:Uncharacterized protein n=1 Tax=Anisakis simplex TaxID=6269 RepID=A0A0M3JUX8_ANISI|nr:unnamed protein product [Anisakis simplex]
MNMTDVAQQSEASAFSAWQHGGINSESNAVTPHMNNNGNSNMITTAAAGEPCSFVDLQIVVFAYLLIALHIRLTMSNILALSNLSVTPPSRNFLSIFSYFSDIELEIL